MERSQRLRSFQSKIFPTTIELWKIPQPFERKPNEQTRWKLSDLVAQYAGAHRWRSPGKFLDNGCRATWEQFASPWRFQATVRNIPKLNGKRLFGTRSRTCIAERERERGDRIPRVTPKTPAGIPEFVGEIPFLALPAPLVRPSSRKTLLSFVRASRYGSMLTY